MPLVTASASPFPTDKRTTAQKEQLQNYFRQTQAPEFVEAQKKATDQRKAHDDYEKGLPNTMVMSEMAKPRDTFIKVRGSYAFVVMSDKEAANA